MGLNVIYYLFKKHNLKTFHHCHGDSLKYSNTILYQTCICIYKMSLNSISIVNLQSPLTSSNKDFQSLGTIGLAAILVCTGGRGQIIQKKEI